MHLNEEKARKYREEQVKTLKFYRLIARSLKDIVNYKREFNQCMNEGFYRTVYGMLTLPISKKEVDIDKKIKYSSFSKGVRLYPYTESIKNSEGYKGEQDKIIKLLIEGHYGFFRLSTETSASKDQSFYLLPNPFEIDKRYFRNIDEIYYKSGYNNGFCDNVLALSNEMAAMYFLQKLENNDNYKHYEEYLRVCIEGIKLENRAAFMENIQFIKEATITDQAIDPLYNMGLFDKFEFELKITKDKIYTPYIK